jgi:predicted 3-demethylubiquinone-9 3-methyltransferase (glyoxalase superfamily)
MPIAAKMIVPCLWFDTQAEAAANHYVAIFPTSKLGKITRYGKEGKEVHGREAGSVMTVEFAEKSQRAMKAMLQMRKFDIAALKRAQVG